MSKDIDAAFGDFGLDRLEKPLERQSLRKDDISSELHGDPLPYKVKELSGKELKAFLKRHKVDISGVVEKSDLVRLGEKLATELVAESTGVRAEAKGDASGIGGIDAWDVSGMNDYRPAVSAHVEEYSRRTASVAAAPKGSLHDRALGVSLSSVRVPLYPPRELAKLVPLPGACVDAHVREISFSEARSAHTLLTVSAKEAAARATAAATLEAARAAAGPLGADAEALQASVIRFQKEGEERSEGQEWWKEVMAGLCPYRGRTAVGERRAFQVGVRSDVGAKEVLDAVCASGAACGMGVVLRVDGDAGREAEQAGDETPVEGGGRGVLGGCVLSQRVRVPRIGLEEEVGGGGVRIRGAAELGRAKLESLGRKSAPTSFSEEYVLSFTVLLGTDVDGGRVLVFVGARFRGDAKKDVMEGERWSRFLGGVGSRSGVSVPGWDGKGVLPRGPVVRKSGVGGVKMDQGDDDDLMAESVTVRLVPPRPSGATVDLVAGSAAVRPRNTWDETACAAQWPPLRLALQDPCGEWVEDHREQLQQLGVLETDSTNPEPTAPVAAIPITAITCELTQTVVELVACLRAPSGPQGWRVLSEGVWLDAITLATASEREARGEKDSSSSSATQTPAGALSISSDTVAQLERAEQRRMRGRVLRKVTDAEASARLDEWRSAQIRAALIPMLQAVRLQDQVPEDRSPPLEETESPLPWGWIYVPPIADLEFRDPSSTSSTSKDMPSDDAQDAVDTEARELAERSPASGVTPEEALFWELYVDAAHRCLRLARQESALVARLARVADREAVRREDRLRRHTLLRRRAAFLRCAGIVRTLQLRAVRTAATLHAVPDAKLLRDNFPTSKDEVLLASESVSVQGWASSARILLTPVALHIYASLLGVLTLERIPLTRLLRCGRAPKDPRAIAIIFLDPSSAASATTTTSTSTSSHPPPATDSAIHIALQHMTETEHLEIMAAGGRAALRELILYPSGPIGRSLPLLTTFLRQVVAPDHPRSITAKDLLSPLTTKFPTLSTRKPRSDDETHTLVQSLLGPEASTHEQRILVRILQTPDTPFLLFAPTDDELERDRPRTSPPVPTTSETSKKPSEDDEEEFDLLAAAPPQPPPAASSTTSTFAPSSTTRPIDLFGLSASNTKTPGSAVAAPIEQSPVTPDEADLFGPGPAIIAKAAQAQNLQAVPPQITQTKPPEKPPTPEPPKPQEKPREVEPETDKSSEDANSDLLGGSAPQAAPEEEDDPFAGL